MTSTGGRGRPAAITPRAAASPRDPPSAVEHPDDAALTFYTHSVRPRPARTHRAVSGTAFRLPHEPTAAPRYRMTPHLPRARSCAPTRTAWR